MTKSTHEPGFYAKKIHWRGSPGRTPDLSTTYCGKLVQLTQTTWLPHRVTCKTCRKFLAYWQDRSEQ